MTVRKIFGKSLGPFCENLIRVLRSLFDDRKYIFEKRIRHFGMKQIAHRINKIQRRLSTCQRLIDSFRMQCRLESVFIAGSTHRVKPSGHHFGITEFAARRDFRTSRRRVPSRFRPFDLGFLSHWIASLLSIKSTNSIIEQKEKIFVGLLPYLISCVKWSSQESQKGEAPLAPSLNPPPSAALR